MPLRVLPTQDPPVAYGGGGGGGNRVSAAFGANDWDAQQHQKKMDEERLALAKEQFGESKRQFDETLAFSGKELDVTKDKYAKDYDLGLKNTPEAQAAVSLKTEEDMFRRRLSRRAAVLGHQDPDNATPSEVAKLTQEYQLKMDAVYAEAQRRDLNAGIASGPEGFANLDRELGTDGGFEKQYRGGSSGPTTFVGLPLTEQGGKIYNPATGMSYAKGSTMDVLERHANANPFTPQSAAAVTDAHDDVRVSPDLMAQGPGEYLDALGIKDPTKGSQYSGIGPVAMQALTAKKLKWQDAKNSLSIVGSYSMYGVGQMLKALAPRDSKATDLLDAWEESVDRLHKADAYLNQLGDATDAINTDARAAVSGLVPGIFRKNPQTTSDEAFAQFLKDGVGNEAMRAAIEHPENIIEDPNKQFEGPRWATVLTGLTRYQVALTDGWVKAEKDLRKNPEDASLVRMVDFYRSARQRVGKAITVMQKAAPANSFVQDVVGAASSLAAIDSTVDEVSRMPVKPGEDPLKSLAPRTSFDILGLTVGGKGELWSAHEKKARAQGVPLPDGLFDSLEPDFGKNPLGLRVGDILSGNGQYATPDDETAQKFGAGAAPDPTRRRLLLDLLMFDPGVTISKNERGAQGDETLDAVFAKMRRREDEMKRRIDEAKARVDQLDVAKNMGQPSDPKAAQAARQARQREAQAQQKARPQGAR